uniref:Retrovirus-related Pol polyprotein from transposon TNT 1-94 n=1 Tax=Noccaea caerulescens TaxID=107243 RepID=A0A1J3CHT4_NOCCA
MSSTGNSSPPNVTETISTTPHTLLTVNMSHVSKLTATNYLMWKIQIHALLDGYDLAGHIDGSTLIPAATTNNGDEILVNPEHTFWKRQDKLIFSSLIGAISPSLQPLVSRVVTSAEVWNTLALTSKVSSQDLIN